MAVDVNKLAQEVELLKNKLSSHLGPQIGKSQVNSPHPKTKSEDILTAGLIAMWSGTESEIPDGWVLCDGTNGTPDLRDKFIVGAGSAYNVGDTGGSDEVTLTTAQMPAHTHNNDFSIDSDSHKHTEEIRESSSDDGDGGGLGAGPNLIQSDTSTESHSHGISGSVLSEGGGEAHENRPPYYALMFIMKVDPD